MKQYIVGLVCYVMVLGNSGVSEAQDPNNQRLQDIYNIVNGLGIPILPLTSQPVTPDNIGFYLFNSSSPQTYIKIDASNASLLSTSSKIFFLFHGWTQNRTTEWYELLKNAFFEHDSECLVVEVDWGTYAGQNYYNAQNATKAVGDIVGDFIATLHKNWSIPLEKCVLVGHSLGGQVVGFAGKRVIKVLDKQLERIIALDPAGTLFEGRLPAYRLDKEDAKIVHVIHTNGGQFGYLLDCGTIDIRPNGGSLQPGCLHEIIKNVTHITDEVFCDHHRSWWFFIEGIRATTPKFVAKKCTIAPTDLLPLPGNCNGETEEMCSLTTIKNGSFFLETNANSPYSKS